MGKMSNQGFKGVPGVPDGWELVAFRPGRCGDWHINADGKPMRVSRDTVNLLCIIRKIEVPKKYRPFANGAEYRPHRDRWVKIASGDNNSGCAIGKMDIGGDRRIDGHNEHSVCIWEGWMTFRDAFKCFTFDDGTPFGVEVTSE
jgi:hypothetical protein